MWLGVGWEIWRGDCLLWSEAVSLRFGGVVATVAVIVFEHKIDLLSWGRILCDDVDVLE